MDFAITTDYVAATGSPGPALQRIAEAGWRWIHWCHHWNDDFLYGPAEVAQIGRWLDDLGLRLLDLHGSNGLEKAWDSPTDYQRAAGVDLVRNRIEMAARLGCDTVIMHPARLPAAPEARAPVRDAMRRSIDDLTGDLRRHGVRLAMENMAQDNFDQLQDLMALYPPDLLGICYDSGHGCIAGNGLDRLEPLAGRLIALHLNDNDGRADLHQPLFMGRVDWPRLAGIIVAGGYDRRAMSVEVVLQHSGIVDEVEFLRHAMQASRRFAAMLPVVRPAGHRPVPQCIVGLPEEESR